MNHRFLERGAAWCGLVYLMLFGMGWLVLAHFFPPIAPTRNAAEVARIFEERHVILMLASVFMMCSTWALLPVSALLVMIIRKIEGGVGMVTLMIGFTLATYLVMNFYTPFSFALAAFRPDRAPEIVQYASDYAFLQFMGGIPMFLGVWALSAYAILVQSPRENPMIPRWFGYFNLWAAILYLPELLVFFFKDGPFAWDGIIGFWIPAIIFIIYFLLTPFILVPVVRKHFS
ncbi:hypothetical protein [Alcanivorax sp.]|uniref:hypothetical protein n=1 Tax=Alcanivorax sp. TaxID=1872427 RepID=UPI0025BE108C|nr:hypothetical protein [Alcanivorax sp.]